VRAAPEPLVEVKAETPERLMRLAWHLGNRHLPTEIQADRLLIRDDHVIVEATGNAAAVVEVLAPHVDRVVIANPKQVRLIAHAKVKTDAIDATVLAKLYATGFLQEI
jgi:phosphoglycerate dehydrogenase-like enzyme